MTDEAAFVGDIHGRVDVLQGMLTRLANIPVPLVFLGDYVDRGPDSSRVIDTLIALAAGRQAETVFLRGNHDEAMLRAMSEDDSIDKFLRMGGAPTISSYIEGASHDVVAHFRRAVPSTHRAFLSATLPSWTNGSVLAVHDARTVPLGRSFLVAGHSARVGLVPTLGANYALIDTGCGTLPRGRLTCFRWPSKEWFQSSSEA
ncbi:metallophosphoesterase [Agrococcus baldri]|uniref:metallophosphoesterase n=1 Tax=Agrococcus baldri TaxID=153730 RepID=UPI000B806E75